jgi:hypothetical protein
MKTSLCILSALALAGGGFASRAAEAAPGDFQEAPEALLKSGYWPVRASMAPMSPVKEPVAGLVSPKAKTGRLSLFGKQIPVALDAATADGELRLLRLDLQLKGDFTAATVMEMKPLPPRQTTRRVGDKIETVTLPPPPNYLTCEGVLTGPAGKVFALGNFYVTKGATSPDGAKREFSYLSLRAINVRVGKTSVAGTERSVALVDGDGNGVFNDAFDPQATAAQMRQAGDIVMIDFGAGDFADRTKVKSVVLDHYLMIDDKTYELQVDPKGRGLKVGEAVTGYGMVRFEAGPLEVLASLTGRRLAMSTPLPFSQATGAKVPAGVYQISSLQVKDPASKAMILLRGGKPLEVTADKTVTIPIETKLHCKISAAVMTPDRQIRLSAGRTVTGGMTVSGVYDKNGKSAPVGFEVLDADGKKIAAGNFEFG